MSSPRGAYDIEARGVSFGYRGRERVLADLSLAVRAGSIYGFLGENGAGKTTTVQILTTLLRPQAGELRVLGIDARADPESVRALIGYTAQETSIDPELTVQENLLYACELYHVPASIAKERVRRALEIVDLTGEVETRAGRLSAGMQKRLDLAASLVHEPRLLFLDEPSVGLDPRARHSLWRHLRELNARGVTIFLTTQYLEEADRLCDRIGLLHRGRIVVEGTPDELKEKVGYDAVAFEFEDIGDEPRRAVHALRQSGLLHPQAELVDATERGIIVRSLRARYIAPDLLVQLRDRGFRVVRFDVQRPSLDDVFERLTRNDSLAAGGAR